MRFVGKKEITFAWYTNVISYVVRMTGLEPIYRHVRPMLRKTAHKAAPVSCAWCGWQDLNLYRHVRPCYEKQLTRQRLWAVLVRMTGLEPIHRHVRPCYEKQLTRQCLWAVLVRMTGLEPARLLTTRTWSIMINWFWHRQYSISITQSQPETAPWNRFWQ